MNPQPRAAAFDDFKWLFVALALLATLVAMAWTVPAARPGINQSPTLAPVRPPTERPRASGDPEPVCQQPERAAAARERARG